MWLHLCFNFGPYGFGNKETQVFRIEPVDGRDTGGWFADQCDEERFCGGFRRHHATIPSACKTQQEGAFLDSPSTLSYNHAPDKNGVPVTQRIRQWFEDSAHTKLKFVDENLGRIQRMADLLVETFRRGDKVLFFGNGGSAMDASHLAAEFVGRYRRERQPLAAVALSADQATLTCIANDYDFSEVFARQILALGRPGDIAVGISTSGNSPNVLKGVQRARAQGLVTVGWTGGTGGKLVDLVDHAFVVPSAVVARIQETHITLGHVLCELVDEALLGKE